MKINPRISRKIYLTFSWKTAFINVFFLLLLFFPISLSLSILQSATLQFLFGRHASWVRWTFNFLNSVGSVGVVGVWDGGPSFCQNTDGGSIRRTKTCAAQHGIEVLNSTLSAPFRHRNARKT